MNRFSDFYLEPLKEEFKIDLDQEEFEIVEVIPEDALQIPVAVNPSRDEFIKIARDKRSKYELSGHQFNGVRIGVLNWKSSSPEIYIWPGGIYHDSIRKQLKHNGIILKSITNWDFNLVWDSMYPNSLITEYDADAVKLIDGDQGRNNYKPNRMKDYKKFQELFSRFMDVKDLRYSNFFQETPKIMIKFSKIKINKIDVREPEYASTIRKYHSEGVKYGKRDNDKTRTDK